MFFFSLFFITILLTSTYRYYQWLWQRRTPTLMGSRRPRGFFSFFLVCFFFFFHLSLYSTNDYLKHYERQRHALMSSAAGYKRKTANFCELRSQASPVRHHNHRLTTRWLYSASPTTICLAGASLTTLFPRRSHISKHSGPRSNS